MSGAHSINKGKHFECKIAEDFRELGWTDCITTRAAVGGNWCKTDNGVDLCSTQPFSVQCKRGAKYARIVQIEEIGREKEIPDTIPLLITKADNKPTMAVLPWSELQKLIQQAYTQ